jgi:hypothetical protein
MVVGQPDPKEGEMAATSVPDPKKGVDNTYAEDDWFDLDQYKKAAQVAYDFSIGKMRESGEQERETIGKGAFEQRETNKQTQQFREKDEERDYKQSQKGYRF